MANIDRILSSPNPPSTEPGTVLLTTPRLILRRPLLTDAPALAKIGNDRAVWSYMTDRFPSPYHLSDAESFLSGDYRANKTDTLEYPQGAGIFLRNDRGEEADMIGFMGMKPGEDINYRMWELGYFIGSEYWGRGYMTELLGDYLRWCFRTWPKLLRVQASTYEFNERSGRVLVKCGFTREGMRRASAEKDGKVMGEVFFGILREDIEGL